MILSMTLGLFLFFQKSLFSLNQAKRIKNISSFFILLSFLFIILEILFTHHISKFWEIILLISTMFYVTIFAYMKQHFWKK